MLLEYHRLKKPNKGPMSISIYFTMCLRDITALRFSAMVSFAAIMYVVCVVVGFSIGAMKEPDKIQG